MKRKVIFKAILTVAVALLTSLVSYAESFEKVTNGQQVIIDNIVYGLGADDHTAILIKGTNRSGDLVIPSKITYSNQVFVVNEIDGAAFLVPSNRGECKITSVVIPPSVKKIGNGAFYQCEYLRRVEIQSNDYEMGNDIFARCSSLESVILSEGVKIIRDGTFDTCDRLKKIIIPRSVERIDGYAFGSKLEEIEILNPNAQIHEKAFKMCPNVKIIGWNGEYYRVVKKKIKSAVYMVNGKEIKISDRQLEFYFNSEEEAEQHRISEKYYITPVH